MREEQKTLLGALIALARATDIAAEVTEETWRLIPKGLAALTGTEIEKMTREIRREIQRLVPDCISCPQPCGRTSEYRLSETEELYACKMELLTGMIRCVSGEEGREFSQSESYQIAKAVFSLGECWTEEEYQNMNRELEML